MEKGNFEGFFPFVIIILVYLLSNLRKWKKNQVKKAPPPIQPPIVKPKPPSTPFLPKIPAQKVQEPPLTVLPKAASVTITQPRIKTVVGRLKSKKDLFILSEILTKERFF